MLPSKTALSRFPALTEVGIGLMLSACLGSTALPGWTLPVGSTCTTPTSCMNSRLTCDQIQKICVPKGTSSGGRNMIKPDSGSSGTIPGPNLPSTSGPAIQINPMN